MSISIKQKTLDHYHSLSKQAAQYAIDLRQPKVESHCALLLASHKCGKHVLDLYGVFDDEDGCYYVTDIALAGHSISIYEFFSVEQILSLNDDCNKYLIGASSKASKSLTIGPDQH